MSPTRVHPSAAASALLLLVASLTAAPATTAGASMPLRVPVGTAEPAPVVEVLDRGSRPRAELRYDIPVGTTQIVTMRTYSNIGQRSGDQVLSGGSPNTTFTMSATVSSVTDVGDLVVDVVYDDVRATDDGSPTFEDYEEAIKPIEGLTASITMTPRGEVVDSTFGVPEGLDAVPAQVVEQLTSQARQLTSPLPEEAVGEGARWTVTTEVEASGFTLDQTTTFTLERVRGSKISVSFEQEQRADRQTARLPGTTGKTTLLSSEGEGRGESQFDLERAPMVVGGEANVEVRQKLRLGGRALSQTIQIAVFYNERR